MNPLRSLAGIPGGILPKVPPEARVQSKLTATLIDGQPPARYSHPQVQDLVAYAIPLPFHAAQGMGFALTRSQFPNPLLVTPGLKAVCRSLLRLIHSANSADSFYTTAPAVLPQGCGRHFCLSPHHTEAL